MEQRVTKVPHLKNKSPRPNYTAAGHFLIRLNIL